LEHNNINNNINNNDIICRECCSFQWLYVDIYFFYI
jgi:hypothetical protein